MIVSASCCPTAWKACGWTSSSSPTSTRGGARSLSAFRRHVDGGLTYARNQRRRSFGGRENALQSRRPAPRPVGLVGGQSRRWRPYRRRFGGRDTRILPRRVVGHPLRPGQRLRQRSAGLHVQADSLPQSGPRPPGLLVRGEQRAHPRPDSEGQPAPRGERPRFGHHGVHRREPGQRRVELRDRRRTHDHPGQ